MPDSSKAKSFQFPNTVTDWSGYNSARDMTNIASNLMVRGSKNIYKKLSGVLAVREGEKRLGDANSTISSISSEFVWNTSWGSTFILTVSDEFLWVVDSDYEWYQLMATSQTRYVFDSWWDNVLKKDVTIFVNGTSNLYKWGGGFAKIASTTAVTIVLDRTILASQLPVSGSIVINGTTYTYSGSAGSTLTGVAGNPTGEANGSAVLESVTTTANIPNADFASDFLKVVNNQVYIGSYTSNRTYISSNTDYTNYTIPTPRVAGSPELIILDGTAKGIGVRQGAAHIGFGSSGWAVVTFEDQVVGTDVTNITKVDIKPVAINQAPLAHEFIGSVGDNLVYLAQDQQVRAFGDFNNRFVAGYPSLSQEIATELSQESFTGGGLRCIGEFIYVTAPSSGKTYIRQERTAVDFNSNIVAERLWHSPFVWNITRIDVVNDTVVGFSNANPQIYQLWGTNQWHDDSPSDENLPYSCVLALGYRNNKNRADLVSFDKIFLEGYIAPGTPLNLDINYNYLGSTNQITTIINSTARPAYLMPSSTDGDDLSGSLGDAPLGENPLGDILSEDTSIIPKFKNINSLALINSFEYQPVFYSDTADARWEILAVGTNETASDTQISSFLINKI